MNAINRALDSKLGRKLRGVSVVDNAANPASAYSKARRGLGAPVRKNNQPADMQKRMDAAFKNTRTFGAPFKP